MQCCVSFRCTLKWISYTYACMLSCFSFVQLFVTLWTVAHQTPLSMRFSRQEYQSGLSCPPPEDLLNPGIESKSLALAGEFFTKSLGKPQLYVSVCLFSHAYFLNIKVSKCNLKAQFFFWWEHLYSSNYCVLFHSINDDIKWNMSLSPMDYGHDNRIIRNLSSQNMQTKPSDIKISE